MLVDHPLLDLKERISESEWKNALRRSWKLRKAQSLVDGCSGLGNNIESIIRSGSDSVLY